MTNAQRGGRPRRRGTARRATPLRVARVQPRREQYDIDKGRACDLPGEVAAASDYVRGALRRNANSITPQDAQLIRRSLDELVARADVIYARAARQAGIDGNTPRRRRKAA